MSLITDKYELTFNIAVSHLISRAQNSRGLTEADVSPRVKRGVEKYLFADENRPTDAELRSFIDDIRADDLCLVLACEKGDEAAWNDLVADFDSTVRSAARKIAANPEDADDLAGSIWAELYGLRQDKDGNTKSKLSYYSGRGSLGGWLRAVIGQLAIDQFRKQSKFVQIEEDREFENLANTASESDNGLIAYNNNPEEEFDEKQSLGDVSKAVKTAVATLDAEDRLLLKMYYFDDLKLKDIAKTFGFHEATASRKLAKIQSEIRQGVERSLKTDHGWTDIEVKKYLADAAAKLGLDLEKVLGLLAVAVIVQEMLGSGVL